jgi:hypothetical protein
LALYVAGPGLAFALGGITNGNYGLTPRPAFTYLETLVDFHNSFLHNVLRIRIGV